MKTITGWKRRRYRLEVAVAHALARAVPLLPRRFVHALGRAVGWVGFYLSPTPRRIALANLDIAYGDAKSRAEKIVIARASFQNFCATFLTFFWTRRLTLESLGDMVEFDEESVQRVREIHARGRGIILVALHYGDWELLAHAIGYRGFPLTIVMEEMRNVALGELFGRLRAHTGHRVIFQRSAAIKLFKALKRGECVATLIDLNAVPRLGGVWVNFFGLPVFNHSAVAALALRTGAAIVGVVAYPIGGGRQRVVYAPEIPCAATSDPAADLQATSQACLTFCEQVIRADPKHWLWSYKRWKHRPTAAQGRYPFYSRPARFPPPPSTRSAAGAAVDH
jgi:KDO2-lipid IV(A) lauroyltransferase